MSTEYSLASNGGSVTATNELSGTYAAAHLIDGDDSNIYHSSGGFPITIEITLPISVLIDQIYLGFVSNQTRSYLIQALVGGSWVTKETVTSSTEASHTLNPTPFAATKVRYVVSADDYTIVRMLNFKVFGTPAPDTTLPSDVTGLTATKISNSRIDIDSDAATDDNSVAGYQTQVSTDGGSTWNTLASTSKAFSFISGNTHFPTTPGTYSLTFRRKAFDTAGTPNYSNNWSNIPTAVSITVPVTPPVASFTLSSSTVVVGGTITLTDTSTNTPTSRQWKLDGDNLATSNPYALDTTGLELGTHTVRLEVSNAGGDDNEDHTFEVIESFLAEHFEKLEICKLFNITDIDLALPLLEADFGDGYGAGVLSGKASGLQRWTISADPILDLTDYNIDFFVDGEPQTDTPLNYFWEFFRRHIALGNKPFYFVEPRTGRKFLASFVEPRLSLKVFTKAVYGTGVQIKQRRFTLEGLEFRESDGSVNE